MPGVRASGAAFLVGFCLIVFGSAGSAAREFGAPALHGVVRDTVGRAIEEAEVLVLGEAAGDTPLAIARTDDRGRFFFAGLSPGVYRVAAIKYGYLAFLGRFDTLLRNSFDLVLRPVPGGNGEGIELPADASWALRLPARSLLRETDAGDLLRREGEGGPRPSGSAVAEVLKGQLDHLVDLGVAVPGGSRETTGAGGAETRMRLASSLGQIGNVQVRGQRESFDRIATTRGAVKTASHEATSLLVEASCATGPDASLAMKASYARGDFDALPGGLDQGERLRHARRSWGYDANWSAQLDPSSRLAVKVGYLDTLASLAEGDRAGAAVTATDVGRPFASRAMAAGGSFESIAANRHQVRVDLEASLQDLPLPQFVAEQSFRGGPADPAGWNVRVRAEDQWLLSTPLTLVYGLGYAWASDGRQTSVVEPRVGGAWTDGAWRARLVLLYDVVADGSSPGRMGFSNAGASRLDPSLGYDAEVEAQLPWGFSLKTAESYEPVAFDAGGAVWERIDPGFMPLYAADGSVRAKRGTITLAHEAAGVQTYLEMIRGSAEGTLAQVFPFEVPLQLLADRRLRYHGGRIGVRVPGSGTDVYAEYRRVEDTAGFDGPSEQMIQEFVELQVAQDLLRGVSRGMSWRFLLAARTSPRRQTVETDPAAAAGLKTLAALSRRVSAGVSLAF